MWRLRRPGGFRPRAHLLAHLPHPTPGQQEQTERKEKMSRKGTERSPVVSAGQWAVTRTVKGNPVPTRV